MSVLARPPKLPRIEIFAMLYIYSFSSCSTKGVCVLYDYSKI